MSSDDKKLSSALAQVRPSWDAARSLHTLPAARARFRAAQLRRRSVVAASCVLSAVLLGVGGMQLWRPDTPQRANTQRAHSTEPTPPAADDRMLRFADGSQVELRSTDARVAVDELSGERVVVRLTAGKIGVDVAHQPRRSFRVKVAELEVEVLGTAFELTRGAEQLEVAVKRGRVAVHTPDGTSVLYTGQTAAFQFRAATAVTAAKAVLPESNGIAAPPMASTAITHPRKPRARGRAHTDNPQTEQWQDAAKQGNFTHAYQVLSSSQRAPQGAEELMLAADAARLSGHTTEAVRFLRQVLDQYPKDAQAPLAAFTLGGLLLTKLDRPREAESAYARARELALSPELAQDALARQVEAAHRAGDLARTRALAEDYVQRYPKGRRVGFVRRLGALP